MGNRDDLLAGAKRLLNEKGYARTTARDIATAAGTSLAAIGYHFGSKEALLNAALLEISGARLGDHIEAGLAAPGPGATLLERFESMWSYLLRAYDGQRELLTARLENIAQVPRVDEVRGVLAAAYDEAVAETARLLRAYEPSLSEAAAMQAAKFCYVLITGTIVQWFTDPGSCPTAADLAAAMRTFTSG
jgi:AcrR family transcriptional regulator